MNSNITYRISTKEARKLFELNPVTGELKVLYTLDFEKLSPEETTHTFVVEAVDSEGTMPPGLATVTVTIMVSQPFYFQLAGFPKQSVLMSLKRLVK